MTPTPPAPFERMEYLRVQAAARITRENMLQLAEHFGGRIEMRPDGPVLLTAGGDTELRIGHLVSSDGFRLTEAYCPEGTYVPRSPLLPFDEPGPGGER